MSKKIIFIADTQSFILRTVSDNLIKSGFECCSCQVNITQINNLVGDADYFFVNLDEEIIQKKDFFVFLRDVCSEKDKQIFFVGYEENLEKVKEVIPTSYIGDFFERPINVKDIVARVKRVVEEGEKEEEQKHILVVDDSGEMLRTVKSWLSGEYRVSMANSAVNAISFLSTNTPDLILLDYEMPVCSGPQMLEMLRGEMTTENIPVMFLTGKSDAASVKAVLSLKPQGYILKSHSKEEILKTISDFFAGQNK